MEKKRLKSYFFSTFAASQEITFDFICAFIIIMKDIAHKYQVEYINKNDISCLETTWKQLEKGSDMSYFQSYDWYEMLNDVYVPEDTKNYVSVYAVVRRDGVGILIAPLWIVKQTFKFVNKKGVYFLGRQGWSDYLNFIYSDFDSCALDLLLHDVKEKYKVSKFFFSEMKQNIKSFQYFISKYNVKHEELVTCVALKLPNTTTDYRSLLSKNARQNIRTAFNRLKKDGIEIRIVFDDLSVNREKCKYIRDQRFVKKIENISKLRLFKYRMMSRLTYHFKSYIPFMDYDKGHFLTVYHKEELCSFFYYLKDEVHRQILFIAAGVNMRYSRYSPGILSLNAFVNNQIDYSEIDIIDFTRGNESYKYAVGGVSNNIETISFIVK